MKTLVNNQNQKRHWWINNNNKKETLMDKKQTKGKDIGLQPKQKETIVDKQ